MKIFTATLWRSATFLLYIFFYINKNRAQWLKLFIFLYIFSIRRYLCLNVFKYSNNETISQIQNQSQISDSIFKYRTSEWELRQNILINRKIQRLKRENI